MSDEDEPAPSPRKGDITRSEWYHGSHRGAELNHTRPASAHALVGAGECSVALYGVARRRCRVSLLPPSADHVLMRISTRLARQGVIRYHPASNMRVIIPLREDPPK